METKGIYAALAAVNKGIKAISKTNYNSGQKFFFRGVDDVMNELHGLFAEHGVMIVPTVHEQTCQTVQTSKGGTAFRTVLTVKYTFVAEDGSYVESQAIGEAHDNADKGVNKAMQAALKYVLLQMFLIPTSEKKDADYDDIQREPDQTQATQQAQQTQQAPETSDTKLPAGLCEKIYSAKTIDQLIDIYAQNPGWHANTNFKGAMSTQKGIIQANNSAANGTKGQAN